MLKCKYCGWRTWNRYKYRKHMKECNHGQSKAGSPEGQETKEKLVEAETEQDATKAENYEKMTILELRDLAREEGVNGIYNKNKAELIEALKG